jgi:hypothetical protein
VPYVKGFIVKYCINYLAVLVLLTSFVFAQEISEPSTASARQQFGVGLVSSVASPIVSLSFQADLGSGVGAEVRLSPFGELAGYALKGSYAFSVDKGYQISAFGMSTVAKSLMTEDLGMDVWRGGVGAGVGIDYAPYVLFGASERSPLWNSFKLGFTSNNSLFGGPAILFSGGAQFRF